MKKNFIATILFFFTFCSVQAQVTFKPGIRAGANLSHFTKGDLDYSDGYYDNNGNFVAYSNETYTSKTDFYVAFYGALHLSKYYMLQPEISYSNQGTVAKIYDGSNVSHNEKLNISYLSFAVVNKFTFGEKFNIHIGPTIDFVVDKNFDNDSDLDLAFLLGAGYNFTKNFGLEARVKKGIVPVLDFSSSDHTNVVFQFGLTYTFDIK